MKDKSITRSKIEEILDVWNKNCEDKGLLEQFKLEYKKVVEEIPFRNKDGEVRTGKVNVGRVTLTLVKITKDDKGIEDISGLLLHQRDFPIIRVTQGKDSVWQEELSKELLYEMLGNFCMVLRGMVLEKIKRIDLNKAIQQKIDVEENAILNKPESEKTEDDKIFSLMNKAKKVKVQKTGIVDKFGKDFVSETIE